MMRLRSLAVVALLPLCFYAQQQKTDSVAATDKQKKKPVATFKDYKIISMERDTTYIDTSLTIQKEFENNPLRRDDFELMPFANMGQTYNHLAYNFNETSLYPKLGARASKIGFSELQDIKFYRVSSPTTELFYKTGMEQGQVLDAFLTLNTSKNLNITIGYKGLRSLGKYKNSRSNVDDFIFSTNYTSKNQRYRLRAFAMIQNHDNLQYGGIQNLPDFESGQPNFDLRSRISVFFEDATNALIGKHYFLENEYSLIGIDKLKIGHQLNYNIQGYSYNQGKNNDFFGTAYKYSKLADNTLLKVLENRVYVSSKFPLVGNVTFGLRTYNLNYVLKGEIVKDGQKIGSGLLSDEMALESSWKTKLRNVLVSANAASNIYGRFGGHYLNGEIEYLHKDHLLVKAHAGIQNIMPNYNMLLYQSDYSSYNYDNTSKFKSQYITTVGANIGYKKHLSLSVDYHLLNNYTFFYNPDNPTQPNVLPAQYNNPIGYTKIKLSAEFKFWKLTLNNSIMYQNVIQKDAILNVPDFVTRNTLFFSSNVFNKAMLLQAGVVFKMFSSYYADGYNPLVSEFFTQPYTRIGNFPLLDFFVNARVKQTRIFLKIDHLNSPYSGYNYYSAPYYPYRDWIFRLGVVWDFFM